MGTVSLATPPSTTDLTSLSRLKETLGIESSDDDVLLGRMISDVSSLIYRIVGRPLYRAQWTETFLGTGRTEAMLSRYPVMSLEAVSKDGDAQTVADFEIASRNVGTIYVSTGFTTSADPNEWSVTYTAGYFLSGDNVTGTGISAATTDDSYNDTGSGFPTLARDGDVITVSGFTGDTSNNGVKTIASTPTAAKVIVDQNLVDDAAGESVTVTFESPEISPFENAVTTLISEKYKNRKRDPAIQAMTVGPISYRWMGPEMVSKAKRMLLPYIEIAP